MKVTIDNQDGKGPVDYSRALCADEATERAAVINRGLNQPTMARLHLDCASHGLPTPVINAFVVITSDNGTFLFTGYLPSAAEPIFVGYSSAGPQYRVAVNAVSEDWLLNRDALPQTAPLLGQTAGEMVSILTNRVNPTLVQMDGLQDVGTIGFFEPMPNLPWSENVAALANQARSAYRVLNGQLTLAPVGSTVHNMSDTVGTIDYAALNATNAKQVVNDVTITGLSQPMEYVTELFEGDGATVLFQLQRDPFRIIRPILLDEEFTTSSLNTSIWQVNDAGGYLSVGGGGLAITGGAGTDGTTTLTTIDPVELGGELVIESGFVQLNSGSDGVLCGLYSGAVGIANCLAGYRVRTSGSNTIVIPLVEGNEVGTAYTMQTGHSYILRIHVHSSELQRMQNSYFSYGSNGPAVYGGGTVQSPLQLLFELQDMALLPYVNIGSTILYDGSVSTSPAIASFACVNSINLQGNVGYFKVTQPGTMWVVSTPSGGTSFTRRIGSNTQGADCNVLRNGFLHFYKLAIPQPGEMVAVTYRVSAPSVARLANNSIQQEGGTGVPAVSQWVGHIVRPPARSSVDCENACQALLNFSSNPAAAWKGTYSYYNLQDQSDIWPGDALNFNSSAAGFNVNVIVRKVTIASTSSSPEVLDYAIEFANDWAETIAVKLTDSISPDVYLPQEPEVTPGAYLPNLNALQVASISTTEITVNANTTPPANGGFEVRSRDYTFGTNVDEDLVLRSPVASFTITRSADEEQFYVRMYDGSKPPLYSRLSNAIFTNVSIS
ncbi:MAG TPA: hypothetical protein VND66_03810 [Acidobacteriaceae bacterium]|nr:hypothetical protein [Terriglobia bacterium]HVC89728.1 hypothetical protein [Acidobacteriaceae bacterium]